MIIQEAVFPGLKDEVIDERLSHQDDFEQEDMFMNEPVEDDTPEPEKPRNKGGRPRKR